MASVEGSHEDKLAARELVSAVNSQILLEEHAKVTNGKVRTRFPPEPNGYLHIGHAKSMNMNFELSFEKLGVPSERRQTFFRYDDTNPEAESEEYIKSLREDVDWLGWKPDPVTFTSDYFPKLYTLAIELIKRGKAYVCHQTKADIEACREVARAKMADPSVPGDACSPWRDRPVEESLREFENMRKGKYDAGEATLRMKMDMTSPNPNMWDQVAYRIKYVPHPHAGSDWCIYPTYDYTHCIIDSLEHIDYSICTLEFETRRESYFWVLEALDLYRPRVYEMSRLNMTYVLLSKRKLLKLVNSGTLRGWDDPRMPTIKGLRRRGYTASILNAFCRDIGATRNANSVQYERLAAVARSQLHEISPRVMAVLRPLKVVLSGLAAAMSSSSSGTLLTVPDFPFDASRGTHFLNIEDVVYIDAVDFRVQDEEGYFGLAPGKTVALKYACIIRCDSYDTDRNTGLVTALHCAVLGANDATCVEKPKGSIQWVPASSAVAVEVRQYAHLFTVEEPSDAEWEQQLNPQSEVVLEAMVDPSVMKWSPRVEQHFQFERIGFYVVDKDSSNVSSVTGGRLVFNLTVTLKETIAKTTGSASTFADGAASGGGALRSRKAEQEKQLAEKLARMLVPPTDMFRGQSDLYSQFDVDGVPTHDAKGEKLSKSMVKKLRKDWEKQKRLFESNISNGSTGSK